MPQIREIIRPPQEIDAATNPTETLNIQRNAAPTAVGATAGIARNVELYNLAYKLAWKHISEDQKQAKADIARQLDESIRCQLKGGATEALFIASEALKDFGY